MNKLRIENHTCDGEMPAFIAFAPADKTALWDAVAYCSFIADNHDTYLTPIQMARLLTQFYGYTATDPGDAHVLDISEERKLYLVRGKPLPRKVALMANRKMEKDGLLETISRLAIVNA